MKIEEILKFFPNLASLNLEERLKLVLRLSVYQAMERSPNFLNFMERSKAKSGLPVKPLPALEAAEFEQVPARLSTQFMSEYRLCLFEKPEGMEAISLWSWYPDFRESVEAVCEKPVTWVQWDWKEGWEKWSAMVKPLRPVEESHGDQLSKMTTIHSTIEQVVLLDDRSQSEELEVINSRETAPPTPSETPKTMVPPPPPASANVPQEALPKRQEMPTVETPRDDKSMKKLRALSEKFKDAKEETAPKAEAPAQPLKPIYAPPARENQPTPPPVAPAPTVLAPTPHEPAEQIKLSDPPISAVDKRQTQIQEIAQQNDIHQFVAKTFTYLQGHFHSGAIFLNKGALVSGWAGYGYFQNAEFHKRYTLDYQKPSVFKIAQQSMQPYHGYVVQNNWHTGLFNNFSMKYPDHMVVLPCTYHGELLFYIVGTCSTRRGKQIDIYQLMDEVQKITKTFRALSKQVEAA